jgi:low affinity Fe/Cu permease
LAQWRDMIDGTYCLEDVQAMHDVLDEVMDAAERARNK